MIFLDLPKVETYFYVNLLGAVLFGIGIALLKYFMRKKDISSLGIGGTIFLWGIAMVVLGIGVLDTLTRSWKEDR